MKILPNLNGVFYGPEDYVSLEAEFNNEEGKQIILAFSVGNNDKLAFRFFYRYSFKFFW